MTDVTSPLDPTTFISVTGSMVTGDMNFTPYGSSNLSLVGTHYVDIHLLYQEFTTEYVTATVEITFVCSSSDSLSITNYSPPSISAFTLDKGSGDVIA